MLNSKLNSYFKNSKVSNSLYENLSLLLTYVSKLTDNNINNIFTYLNDIANKEQKTKNKDYIVFVDNKQSLALDTILISFFGSGFKHPTDWSCKSYGILIDLLGEIEKIVSIDMNSLIDDLDEITTIGCLYDENGHIIFTEDMNDKDYEELLQKV